MDRRKIRKNSSYPAIFSSFGEGNSLAVRYFATSEDHQELLAGIEKWACEKRERKKAELAEKKDKYNELMNRYSTSSCEFKDVYDEIYHYSKNVHSSSCTRCANRDRAVRMKVNVDDLPLPRGNLKAQATVFELKCPKSLNDWRDATLFLNKEVLKLEYSTLESPNPRYDTSCCLSTFIGAPPQRLRLISTTKPHAVTHRNGLLISDATEASVCVNNGLIYRYFDNRHECYATTFSRTKMIPKMCTYQLGRYKPLQAFIYRPHYRSDGPQPNLVISKQHACPIEMSLEEFKSLGTLPLGVQLQWSNILLQLSQPAIDFKAMNTALVILQIIRQAGPRSGKDIAPDGHQELRENLLGWQLVHALRAGLERIKENWESRHALGILIAISTRLLSLTESVEVAVSCLEYLRQCRQVALDWLRKLRTMVRDETVQDQRDELSRRVFEIALVCTSTFEVELSYLKNELHVPAESAHFVECSIIVHESGHSALVSSDVVQRISVQRWRRLSSRALSLLLAEIVDFDNPCIDMAIGRCWSGYSPGGDWQSQVSKARHWVTTTTASQSDAASQIVHYNILSGELLVDGLPLSRLPQNFEQHGMYRVLFDRSTIEVIRTQMPGMEFSAMNRFRDYEVFFGLRTFSGRSSPALAGPDLMLTCIKHRQRCDLLPPRIFRDKLPDNFVDKFVDWYRHGSRTVEFRPISDPWVSSQDHWVLSKTEEGWVMRRGSDTVLTGMTSTTANREGNL